MASNASGKKWPLAPKVVLSIAALVGFALLIELIITEPQRKGALQRFFSTPPNEVTQIVLRPASPSSPIKTPVVLTYQTQIVKFLAVIRRSSEFSPNHPLTEWKCEIEIVTSSGASTGTISATSNQGVLLQIHASVASQVNFGF